MISDKALQELESFNASHHAQDVALTQFLRYWRLSRTNHKISAVVGPAGVGKDRLIELASDAIAKETKGGRVIVLDSANEVGQAAFSMKWLLALVLHELEDPDPTRHTAPRDAGDLSEVARYAEGKTGIALLIAVRERLNAFKPAALFLNEANYLAHGTSDRAQVNARIQANMRNLTYLAWQTNVPIGLFGTYPMLRLPKAGIDVNRRMRLVHFPRYGDAGESLELFGRAAAQFERFLVKHGIAGSDFSVRTAPVLRELYETTFGLVGLMRDLIVTAACDAQAKRRRMTVSDIHAALGDVVCDPTDFERKLLEGERDAAMSGRPNPYPFRRKAKQPEEGAAKGSDSRTAARTVPVGERRLSRDRAFGVLGAPDR